MKKLTWIAAVFCATLVACNNDANDGDPATDTTNTTQAAPTSAAPYGDTAFDVNNDGTKTNLNMRTDVDSMSNSNRPGDSTGGLGSGVKDKTPASEGQN